MLLPCIWPDAPKERYVVMQVYHPFSGPRKIMVTIRAPEITGPVDVAFPFDRDDDHVFAELFTKKALVLLSHLHLGRLKERTLDRVTFYERCKEMFDKEFIGGKIASISTL